MPDSPPPIIVVNIISASYSGSTWLNLLLGSHSQALSLGEAKRILLTEKPVCSICPGQCPVFSRIDLKSPENFFLQVAGIAARRVLVVNNSRKLLPAQQDPRIERRFIHLLRDGRPTTASYLRKNAGHSMWTAARWWTRSVRRNARLVRRQPDPAVTIRYEDITANTARELERLCRFIGVAYEPAMLQYWNKEHHFIGGNVGTLLSLTKKRNTPKPEQLERQASAGPYNWDLDHYKKTDPEHFVDERWRTELSPGQLRMFRFVAARLNRKYGYQP